ncbi:MAG: porin family protein [Candidatus Aminicenantes bacterium]
MKKLMTAVVVAAFAGLVLMPAPAAADLRFGIKGGVNAAKIFGEDADLEGDWQNKLGFCAGVFLQLNIGSVLTIQPEVLYTMKGAKLEETFEDVTYTGKLLFDYLEIPLLVKLRIPTGRVSPFVFAGPSIGFKLSSKIKFTGGGESSEEDLDELKSVDYGAIFGAGLNLGRSFHLDVRYSMGLQKLIDDPEIGTIDIKNGVISATVGFAF